MAILEFSRPRGVILGRLYLGFFRHVLPRVGQGLAPNSYDAYSYLPASVLQFPDGQAMLDLLASARTGGRPGASPDVRGCDAVRRDQAAAGGR